MFVTGCFVLQEGQLAQVAAFLIDDGFDRVCGNGNGRSGVSAASAAAFAGVVAVCCCAACCAGLGLGLGKKCSQPAKIATEMAKNAISLFKIHKRFLELTDR